MSKLIDLTNQKFGRLTVLREIKIKKQLVAVIGYVSVNVAQ